MSQGHNDDLFTDSTMTFGEHLEELRRALILSLGGMFVGFLLGLAVATQVVEAIKKPLQSALETFYKERAVQKLEDQYGEQVPEGIKTFVTDQEFVYEEIQMEAAELVRVGRMFQPGNKKLSANLGDEADETIQSDLPAPSLPLIKTRIWRPTDPAITTLNPQEAFLIWIKAGLVTGVVVSSPWIFWHIWTFVAAGLYRHEKRYIYVFLPFSVGLFLAGVALAYFFVFQPVLDFLLSFNRMMNIHAEPRISEWLSFVLFLPLGFGISFQLPLVMLFLERIGIFTTESYLEKWRMAILVIFVIAMLLTPADPISMLLMAVPLTFLYFGGVALCKWMPGLRRPIEYPDEDR